MSLPRDTLEQQVSAKILEKIKARGSSNTTFLIDNTAPPRKLTRQNEIADEAAKDKTVSQRKITNVPGTFGPNNIELVVYGDKDWMEANDVITKLNASESPVREIISYGPQIPVIDGEEAIPDFELAETVDIITGTGRSRSKETLQIFRRTKVNV